MTVMYRLLHAYRSRIADEGDYDDTELPEDLVEELEGAATPAQQTFAVGGRGYRSNG